MSQILDYFNNILVAYNDFVGGYLLLAVLVPTGIFLTIKYD